MQGDMDIKQINDDESIEPVLSVWACAVYRVLLEVAQLQPKQGALNIKHHHMRKYYSSGPAANLARCATVSR